MDSQNLSEFDKGYKAGIAHAAYWIDQYMEARKSVQPARNRHKRKELVHIKEMLIRYIDPYRKPTRPAIRAKEQT